MKARSAEAEKLEKDYMLRLKKCIAQYNPVEVVEIEQDVIEHIEEAVNEFGNGEVSLTEMSNVLEKLGPPEIYAEEVSADYIKGNPEKENAPGNTNKRNLLYGCLGCLVLMILSLLVVGGIWFWFKIPEAGPKGRVHLPSTIEPYAIEYMKEHKILEEGEEIRAYYDKTVDLNGSEAAILTSKRVIYHKKGNNDSIRLPEIESIAGGEDVIVITSRSGKIMKIEIAPNKGQETFFKALEKAWKNSNT